MQDSGRLRVPTLESAYLQGGTVPLPVQGPLLQCTGSCSLALQVQMERPGTSPPANKQARFIRSGIKSCRCLELIDISIRTDLDARHLMESTRTSGRPRVGTIRNACVCILGLLLTRRQ